MRAYCSAYLAKVFWSDRIEDTNCAGCIKNYKRKILHEHKTKRGTEKIR